MTAAPKSSKRRVRKPSHTSTDPDLGICIVGGGILGAVRALAMLAGIEESLSSTRPEGLPTRILVGSRSGALVAGLLGQGARPGVLLDGIRDEERFLLKAGARASLEVRNIMRVVGEVLRTLWRRGRDVIRDPLGILATDEVRALLQTLPAGLLTTAEYERTLNRLFWNERLPRHFDDCSIAVRILAWDLHAGSVISYGNLGLDDPSVPQAIAAASTLPGIFAPTRVGDCDVVELPTGLVPHLRLAMDGGAQRLLVMAPSPPAGAHGGPITGHPDTDLDIRTLGMAAVWTQTQRQAIREGLKTALERHRSEHPAVRVAVVEPPAPRPAGLLETAASHASRNAAIEQGLAVGRAMGSPSGEVHSLFSEPE